MKHDAARLDLTSGSIVRLSLLFALPICIGNMLQSLYTTVDTLVISNYCGTNSLAAIGTSAQPVEILMCIFMGIGSGVSILVSQHVGAGNAAQLKDTVRSAVSLVYLCALPVTVLGVLLGPVILRLMQVPEETVPAAIAYMDLVFMGTLATIGYNTNAGVLRGLGDSRSTLYFLLISCGVNIVLDLVFVALLNMDVTGAALATIIAQYLSWITSGVFLARRYPDAGYSFRPAKVRWTQLKPLLTIGVPLGLNHSIYSIGHLVLQLLVNTQGTVFMAACSVGSKVNNLCSIGVTSLASAATTFSGQNLGAGKYDRLQRGAWVIPLLSGGVSLVVGVCLAVFARPILTLFAPEPEVMDLAARFIQIVVPFFWTFAVFNAIISFVNGMGVVRYPTIVNILMLWAVRIPVALAVVRFFDGTFVMIAYPISFTFGMCCMLCYFLTPAWRRIREQGKAQSI